MEAFAVARRLWWNDGEFLVNSSERTPPTRRVVVIEDDPTMGEMVAYNLRRQGYEAVLESDGAAGLRRAEEPGTALVVLDLMLPGLDGLQIAEQLRRTDPYLPILILTARGEEEVKLRGFASGADDFLTKPFSMEELVARVKALLRRTVLGPTPAESPPPTITFGDLRLEVRDMRCWVRDEEVELRPKEFSLLATIAGEPGRLFSRGELAHMVWGYSTLANTRTIDTHVKNVRRKVEGSSAFRYIETIRGLGYRFRVVPKDAS